MSTWNRALQTYRPGPVRQFYERTIHLLLEQGYETAMVPAGANLEEQDDSTLREYRIRRISHHDRSGKLEDFIEFELTGKADPKEWLLLPVFDDNEYVSWDFYFLRKPKRAAWKPIDSGNQRELEDGRMIYAWIMDDGVALLAAKDHEQAVRIAIGNTLESMDSDADREEYIKSELTDGRQPWIVPVWGVDPDQWDDVKPYGEALPKR